jgi:hypothetical protein
VTTLGAYLRAGANRNSECEQFNALRKLLGVSRTCLRQLVAEGMLRVHDPRITQASLASWCAKNCAVNPTAVFESTAVTNLRQHPCSRKRAARILNVEVADVQRLVSAGQLKLVDTFVTDRAFEEFCRKHGTTINIALI